MGQRRILKVITVSILAVFAVFSVGSVSAGHNRGTRPDVVRGGDQDPAFEGTHAEFAAWVIQEVLIRAGHDVRKASPALSLSMKRAFGGSPDFIWSEVLVKELDSISYALAFPNDIQRMQNGELALALLSGDALTGTFRLQMTTRDDGLSVLLSTPDGVLLGSLSLEGSSATESFGDDAALRAFAKVFVPDEVQSGVFDPIIEILEMIKDILYDIKGIINVLICIINESIEFFTDLNYCFPSVFEPGGGAFINLVICTIESTIEFIEELAGTCA